MERKVIRTPDAPAAIGPYSQALRVGDLVFCSGQIPLDPESGELVGAGDARAQARRVLDNVRGVLRAAGSDLDRVAKVTVYLASMDDFVEVNEVYGEFFSGVAPPARATVEVSRLPRGALVEMDAIAMG